MSQQEFREMRETLKDGITKYNVDALMTCFALAERRLYKFGPTRIFRSLQYIDDLMGDVLNGSATIEGYKRELKEETGVVIKS